MIWSAVWSWIADHVVPGADRGERAQSREMIDRANRAADTWEDRQAQRDAIRQRLLEQQADVRGTLRDD